MKQLTGVEDNSTQGISFVGIAINQVISNGIVEPGATPMGPQGVQGEGAGDFMVIGEILTHMEILIIEIFISQILVIEIILQGREMF